MAKINKNEQIRRPLPAELLFEMFGCLPLANSYGLLAQMPNAILARNVRGVLNRTQMLVFDNKWANCGPDLGIFANGLESMRNRQLPNDNIWPIHVPLLMVDKKHPNSVTAQMPVRIFKGGIMPKKPYITGYYEVQILVCDDSTIPTGFSDPKFPLDGNFIGNENNSVGSWHKTAIKIDGKQYIHIAPGIHGGSVRAGDVMGCGISHFPENNRLKFFFTCNGQLLGSAILPPKFLHIPLFATATMWKQGSSIRANFGKQKFRANLADILVKLI